MKLPGEGIHFPTEAALREAAASDFNDVISLVQGALRVQLGKRAEDWVQIDAIYPERVVYVENGRRWSYDYTLDDNNQVTLSNRQEVVKDHKPVALREACGAFIEATSKKNHFLIRVIRAGLSGNGVNYPPQVLREATPLFNGVRVFSKSDREHLRGQGKDVSKLIGKLSNASFIEAQGQTPAEIQAELTVLESTGMAERLREALENDMTDLFGFSIDAQGLARRAGKFREARSIKKVKSVDLIVEPGAGGELLSFIEALNEDDTDMKLRDRMIATIKQHNPEALASLDVEDDDAVEAAYREAVSPGNDAGNGPAAGPTEEPAVGVTSEELDEKINMVEARASARVLIAECNLPAPSKTKLRKDFAERTAFVEADVSAAIESELAYLGELKPSGFVEGLGEGSLEAGQDRSEKVAEMLDGFFDRENRDVRSFRECYIEITGDVRVTGDLRKCDARRLREAVPGDFREALDSTSFSNVLGDSITRAMLREYNLQSELDIWRQLVDVVPVGDFRTQERTRYGGYGDLPAVAQSGSYDPLTSPGDEKATYAVTKRGGTENVTLEMIKNDDAGVIIRIPRKLARSGKRTLSKFCMDFLRTNPAIYDSVALFHASHGNLGTASLDATALAAGRLAMMKQQEAGSSEPLGIPPVNLWIPPDLEELSVNLFRRSTENDKTFVQSLVLNIVPVWYWTDANDWCLSANPADIPTIEIGFLDGNEEPELFVQDSPTQGSLFTNDQIMYKIRHIYGGDVVEYRGLYKGVVA